MEGVCDRLLELDGGKAFVHNFGGANSYNMWKEVRPSPIPAPILTLGIWRRQLLGPRALRDALPPQPPTQAREFRRKAQANAAADARTLFRREAEWMAKQPKARQVGAVLPYRCIRHRTVRPHLWHTELEAPSLKGRFVTHCWPRCIFEWAPNATTASTGTAARPPAHSHPASPVSYGALSYRGAVVPASPALLYPTTHASAALAGAAANVVSTTRVSSTMRALLLA